MGEFVEIFEVGPRDGLQNEDQFIPTAEKIALIDCLSQAGFKRIEVASFVSPKWVPQMADAAEVLGGIARAKSVSYACLTPNMRGLQGAIAAKADEIAVFGSASEGFSQANINCSIDESLDRFRPVVETGRAAGLRVRGYVSCVIACPYDGPTDPAQVAKVARDLIDMGCYEVSLGDTIGVGTPDTVSAMLSAVLNQIPAVQLAGHFHDTNGQALSNIDVALEHGLRIFDAAIGGLGGCPYAPGSKGNVATELVHAALSDGGFVTGLNGDILRKASQIAQSLRQEVGQRDHVS